MIGLQSYPVDHVLKNSLFFFILPLIALLKPGRYINKNFIELLIKIIVLQVSMVVVLDYLGVDVYNRSDWFQKVFGYYRSGGTVVETRFHSYNFTILLCLVFMRIKIQERLSFIDVLLISFCVYLSGSKGIVLAAFLPFLGFIHKKDVKFSFRKSLSIVFILVVMFLIFPLVGVIRATFDPEDISNATRLAVSAKLIIDPSNIFGNGFGASLPSEYVRSGTSPYGFEISYVSYYHKLGVVFIALCVLMITIFGTQTLFLTAPVWISALGNPTLTHLANLLLLYLALSVAEKGKGDWDRG